MSARIDFDGEFNRFFGLSPAEHGAMLSRQVRETGGFRLEDDRGGDMEATTRDLREASQRIAAIYIRRELPCGPDERKALAADAWECRSRRDDFDWDQVPAHLSHEEVMRLNRALSIYGFRCQRACAILMERDWERFKRECLWPKIFLQVAEPKGGVQ